MKTKIKRIIEIQNVLKNRRNDFIENCSPEKMRKAYIKNRYYRHEKRNFYEVERIWDKLNSELIDKMIQSYSSEPTFKKYIFQILKSRADRVSSLLKKNNLEIENELLNDTLSALKKAYDEDLELKSRLIEHKNLREEQREFEFIELIVEMMDILENKNQA